MNKWLIGIGIAVLAAALGTGAAYGAVLLAQAYAPQARSALGMGPAFQQAYCEPGDFAPDKADSMRGMIGRAGRRDVSPRGDRAFPGRMQSFPDRTFRRTDRKTGAPLSMDDARKLAEEYAADADANLKLAEGMEFERNFYFVLIESATGRGAMEVLVDKYTGDVIPEPGPNRMWNIKYGMGCRPAENKDATDNTLDLAEARRAAQDYLDKELQGAKLVEHGFVFYGYYTFDYSVEGKTAGMLSVNGFDGSVWLHTWHGEFISEMEVDE